MKSLLKSIVMLLFASICSCVGEYDGRFPSVVDPSEESYLHINISRSGDLPTSKSLTVSQEEVIKDIYVFALKDGIVSSVAEGVNITNASFEAKLIVSKDPTDKYRLVVLANVKSYIDAKETGLEYFNGKLYSELQSEFISGALTEPLYATTPTNKKAMIMWGETKKLIELKPSTKVDNINLLRALARVDVGIGSSIKSPDGTFKWDGLKLGSTELIPFDLTSVHVFRPQNEYSFIPKMNGSTTTIFDHTTGQVKEQSAIGVKNEISAPWNYTTLSNTKYTTRQIYLPESDVKMGETGTFIDNNHENRAALVVGGKYNGSNTTTYYRIDFSHEKKLCDVIRNHQYQVSIRNVFGVGYVDPETAYKARSMNLTADVIDWTASKDHEIIFDGVNWVSIQSKSVILPGGNSAEAVQNLSISSNIDVSRWKMSFNGVDFVEANSIENEFFKITKPTQLENESELGSLEIVPLQIALDKKNAATLTMQIGDRIVFPIDIQQLPDGATDGAGNYIAASTTTVHLASIENDQEIVSIVVKAGAEWEYEWLEPTEYFKVEKVSSKLIISTIFDNTSSDFIKESILKVKLTDHPNLFVNISLSQDIETLMLTADGKTGVIDAIAPPEGGFLTFHMATGSRNATWSAEKSADLNFANTSINGIHNSNFTVKFDPNLDQSAPSRSGYVTLKRNPEEGVAPIRINFTQQKSDKAIFVSSPQVGEEIHAFLDSKENLRVIRPVGASVDPATYIAHNHYTPKLDYIPYTVTMAEPDKYYWELSHTFYDHLTHQIYTHLDVDIVIVHEKNYPLKRDIIKKFSGAHNEKFYVMVQNTGPGDKDLVGTITLKAIPREPEYPVVNDHQITLRITSRDFESDTIKIGSTIWSDRNQGNNVPNKWENGVYIPALNYTIDVKDPDNKNNLYQGDYYTFKEALLACPFGWRLPTLSEMEELAARIIPSKKRYYFLSENKSKTGKYIANYLSYGGGNDGVSTYQSFYQIHEEKEGYPDNNHVLVLQTNSLSSSDRLGLHFTSVAKTTAQLLRCVREEIVMLPGKTVEGFSTTPGRVNSSIERGYDIHTLAGLDKTEYLITSVTSGFNKDWVAYLSANETDLSEPKVNRSKWKMDNNGMSLGVTGSNSLYLQVFRTSPGEADVINYLSIQGIVKETNKPLSYNLPVRITTSCTRPGAADGYQIRVGNLYWADRNVGATKGIGDPTYAYEFSRNQFSVNGHPDYIATDAAISGNKKMEIGRAHV